jgi:hypothetical protein
VAVVQFRKKPPAPPDAEAASAKRSGALALAGRIAREPLTHFFLVGLLVFVAAQSWRHLHSPRRIVVTPAIAQDLATKYQLQFGSAPTAAKLDQLVSDYVDEEVLYREGMAQGLDRGDEIVRRRVAQKAQFLMQDLAPPAEPTDAELQAWYRDHLADYSTPAQVTFTHLYFSPDRGGDAAAHARAQAALAKLQAGASPDAVGADPFPDLDTYANLSAEGAARVFGRTDLSERLMTAPLGRWSGPYRSAYGWHLVRAAARSETMVKPFSTVSDQVHGDFLQAAQHRANVKSFAALKARYQVIREDQRARP